MPSYRLHYFPESGNSYKLALMLTLCGEKFEPVWTDFGGGVTRTAEWREAVNEMGEIPVLEVEAQCLPPHALLATLPVVVTPPPRVKPVELVTPNATVVAAKPSSHCTPASPRLSVSAMICAWVTGTKSAAWKKSPTLI